MVEVAAIILAAGRASRFGAGADDSKVLAELAGEPLIRRVAATALASRAAGVHVVTGHAAGRVAAAVAGLAVTSVFNPDHASGLASSLKAGIASLPPCCDGALVLLADMPMVRRETLCRLIAAFAAARHACDAVVPVHHGERGNPVLLARALFPAAMGLEGDEGARRLLRKPSVRIVSVEVDDPGIALDIDTQAALAALRAPA